MLSTASSLLALGSVVYSAILNRSERNRETIQTWTCRFDSGLPLPTEFDSIDSKLTNESFSKLCTESVSAPYRAYLRTVLMNRTEICLLDYGDRGHPAGATFWRYDRAVGYVVLAANHKQL